MRRATGAVVFAKRQRLNLLRTANGPFARQLLGELMMSPKSRCSARAGTPRCGCRSTATSTSRGSACRRCRGARCARRSTRTTSRCSRRSRAAQVVADAVLLRMEQHELEPDATSYAAVLRSTRGRPGSARFGRRLLEEAEGASGLGAAAGSDGVAASGILAAARGEAAASAAAAGGAELQDA